MKRLVDLKLYSILSDGYLDNLNWISLEDALETLSKNNVSIISFTDFNLFKASFYHNIVTRTYELGYKFKIFPGTEIVFSDAKNKFKAILVFSDKYNDSQLDELQNLINAFINNKNLSIQLMLDIFRKYEYEFIIDLNTCEKIDIKYLKKISRRINYVICEKTNAWYIKISNEFNKEVQNLVFYETNNWSEYHAPKTYVETEENQDVDFKMLFTNLKSDN